MYVTRADDSSSLLEPAELQHELSKKSTVKSRESVKLERLDERSELLDAASGSWLLKIDVQGAELQVLQGSRDLLGRFQVVYVECSFREMYRGQALVAQVEEYLSKHGFELSRLRNPTFVNGDRVQADLEFRRTGLPR
jgi:hypothetical protein